MQQLFALLGNRVHNRGMPVTKRIHTDAAQQIEVAVALLVDKVHTFATDEENGIALVGLQQRLRLCRLHGGRWAFARSSGESFRCSWDRVLLRSVCDL